MLTARVSQPFQVTRIGTQHQAGSDSLLTAATFFKMRKVFFDDRIEDEFYRYNPSTPPLVPAIFALLTCLFRIPFARQQLPVWFRQREDP